MRKTVIPYLSETFDSIKYSCDHFAICEWGHHYKQYDLTISAGAVKYVILNTSWIGKDFKVNIDNLEGLFWEERVIVARNELCVDIAGDKLGVGGKVHQEVYIGRQS